MTYDNTLTLDQQSMINDKKNWKAMGGILNVFFAWVTKDKGDGVRSMLNRVALSYEAQRREERHLNLLGNGDRCRLIADSYRDEW